MSKNSERADFENMRVDAYTAGRKLVSVFKKDNSLHTIRVAMQCYRTSMQASREKRKLTLLEGEKDSQ